ncbi:MAG TPA: hypothetical protein VGZ52_00295 [Acidimicrobiales bacterium]|nr:hypothetical protein [Acidimicrobiales bacterium]
MDPGFEAQARAVYARAAIDVSDDDLALVALIQAGYEGNTTLLDQLDAIRFPFEPIDPSRAP